MAEGVPLRRIADPVVAAAPARVRIRTRMHPTDAEVEALAVIGEFLGSVYRGELTGRVRLGRVDREAQAAWRAERKQAVTAVSSSRWAGAITRAAEDQYQLGMRGVAVHVADPRAAVRCWRPGARCGPANWHQSTMRPAGHRDAGVIAVPLSGFARPGAWQRCVRGWPPLSGPRRRVDRRSQWAANACGAPVITSTRPA